MVENDVEIVLWRTGGQDVRTSRRKAFTPGGAKMMYMQKKVERDEGPIVG